MQEHVACRLSLSLELDSWCWGCNTECDVETRTSHPHDIVLTWHNAKCNLTLSLKLSITIFNMDLYLNDLERCTVEISWSLRLLQKSYAPVSIGGEDQSLEIGRGCESEIMGRPYTRFLTL